jgi:hypothetical protein
MSARLNKASRCGTAILTSIRAEAVAAVGIVGQLIFGLYRTGQLKEGWPGSRDDHAGAVPLKGSPAVLSVPSPSVHSATRTIQLAPPAVGCSAYLSITSGPPDLFAQALIGYALFQVLLRCDRPHSPGRTVRAHRGEPHHWRHCSRHFVAPCSGDGCSRLRSSRPQKACTQPPGLYRICAPEWPSADPKGLVPEDPSPHLSRHSPGIVLTR